MDERDQVQGISCHYPHLLILQFGEQWDAYPSVNGRKVHGGVFIDRLLSARFATGARISVMLYFGLNSSLSPFFTGQVQSYLICLAIHGHPWWTVYFRYPSHYGCGGMGYVQTYLPIHRGICKGMGRAARAGGGESQWFCLSDGVPVWC